MTNIKLIASEAKTINLYKNTRSILISNVLLKKWSLNMRN